MNGKNPRQIALRVLLARTVHGEYTETLLEQALSGATGTGGPFSLAPLGERAGVRGNPARRSKPSGGNSPSPGGEGRGLPRHSVAKAGEGELSVAEARGSDLSPLDRALCQELVYGIVRRQATLDWLIARKTDGRQQNPGMQNLLRLGLYQIFWLDRIPPHAAVHETVELAKREGYGPKAGFINAVLRGYLREFDATKQLLADLKTSNSATGFSHPQWLVEKWQIRFGGDRTRQLLEWNNIPPKNFARVNVLKTDAGKLIEKWREEDVEYDFVRRNFLSGTDLEAVIFELKSHPPLTSLESFRNGWFYIQDPSTLLAALQLAPQPGETILDLCAAPGGKTTYLAQLMNNTGKIIACDISAERLKLLEENCLRLGVTCVEPILNSDLIHSSCVTPSNQTNPSTSQTIGGTFSLSQRERAGVRENRSEEDRGLPRRSAAKAGEGELSVAEARGSDRIENPKSKIPNLKSDRILIDSPCSNTGVLRRRVDLRWRITPDEILRLQQTQLDLLKTAAPQLKPGGVIVYSTCSLEPEENTVVIQEFLRAHPDFKLEHEHELLPFADNVDGAFVARLKKL